jgi:5'(3')-deoxyribonucleotidase
MEKHWILDCDEVLAGFRQHLFDVVGTKLKSKDIPEWDLWDHLGPHKQAALDLCKDPVFWLTLPVLPGAEEGVQAIRAAGYDITIATSGWATCTTWADCRYEWLRKNFDIHRDDVLIGDKKYKIHGDVFQDDKPSHVTKWSEAHPEGIAFLHAADVNQEAGPEFFRAEWPEIIQAIP